MPTDLESRIRDIVARSVSAIELAVRQDVARGALAMLGNPGAMMLPAMRAAPDSAPPPAAQRPATASTKSTKSAPSTKSTTSSTSGAPAGGHPRGADTADVDRVLEVIGKNPGIRSEHIPLQTDVAPAIVKKALARLRALGAVTTDGIRRGTTYQLAGAARVSAAVPGGRSGPVAGTRNNNVSKSTPPAPPTGEWEHVATNSSASAVAAEDVPNGHVGGEAPPAPTAEDLRRQERDRLIVLRKRMEMEMKGIKFRRSAFTIARRSFNLRGSRLDVFRAFNALIERSR